MMSNPVHYAKANQSVETDEGEFKEGWYFWDETWAYRFGPYLTQDQANVSLDKYVKEVLGT